MAIVFDGVGCIYSTSLGASRPSAFSIATWFKSPNAPSAAYNTNVLSVGNSAQYPTDLGDLVLTWDFTSAGARNRAGVHYSGTNYQFTNTAGAGTAGVWVHKAAVFDGSGVLFYENGSLVGARAARNITAGSPADWIVTIGGGDAGTVSIIKAGAKAVAAGYWNTGLTAEDVSSLGKGIAPIKVRPQSLKYSVLGLRNGNAQVGVTASVGGGLTFDDDNPRLYL